MAVLALDTVGFLQTINRLERRFDELTSSTANHNIDEYLGQYNSANQQLYALASDVFGNGGWATTICVAATSCAGDLADGCKRFMTGSATVVRKYGMAVWLYDLIHVSSKTLYAQECSSHMCRFGAYSLLRWGANEPRSLDIAGMLLTHPRLGVCMLRDDAVMALGSSPDIRYRRAVDYLKYLRVSADLDYARALADNDVPSLEGERALGFAVVDQRYVYDAKRLVEAYESMWHDDKQVRRAGHEILAEVERSGVRPDIPLWRNPAYLHDLAVSLLGPFVAADLCNGFDQRDRARFDKAVAQLRDFADFVRDVGMLMLPVCVLQAYTSRCLDKMLKHRPRHSKQTNGGNNCNTGVHVGADMAAVAIARMPSESLARTLGMALLQREPSQYHELVLKAMGESAHSQVPVAPQCLNS